MANVNVVIGAGSIGQAIARRVSAGKRVLLADDTADMRDYVARLLGLNLYRGTARDGVVTLPAGRLTVPGSVAGPGSVVGPGYDHRGTRSVWRRWRR